MTSSVHSGIRPEWQHDPIELKSRQYSIGIEWDELGSAKMDLDLQAVIVDNHGTIVDAVYYNNLEALGGAIGSQGDAQDGDTAQSGLDEVIWLTLTRIPPEIELIVFVVTAYGGRSLKDVDNGKIALCETVNSERKRIGTFRIEHACADADIVGMIRRTKELSWVFVGLEMPAEIGSHFLDILEPQIGDIIRHEIPHAPKKQNVSFQMDKGSVVHFQGAHCLKRLSISLDADVADDATEAVDMDITAVFYSEDHQLLGAVDSVNEAMFGVGHSGEMHYENHEHIQESLSVDLHQMPEKVKHIFIVLTIQHGSFRGVKNVHMHVADQDAQDKATMNVEAGHKESGLVVARIYDTNSRLTKRWALQSVGKFFSHGGTSWHTDECKKEMLHLLHCADGDHSHRTRHVKKLPHEAVKTGTDAKSGAKSSESSTKTDKKTCSSATSKKVASKSAERKTKATVGAAIARPSKKEAVPPELTPEVVPANSKTSVTSPSPEEKILPPSSSTPPTSKTAGVLRKKGNLRTQVSTIPQANVLTDAPKVESETVSAYATETAIKLEPRNPDTTCEIVQVACTDEAEPPRQEACACTWSQRFWCRR